MGQSSDDVADYGKSNVGQNTAGAAMTPPPQLSDFVALCKPIREWLAKNHHPHVKIIIDKDGAELVEGVMFFSDHLGNSGEAANG